MSLAAGLGLSEENQKAMKEINEQITRFRPLEAKSLRKSVKFGKIEISALNPLRSALKRTQTSRKRTETADKRTDFGCLLSAVNPVL